jgi:hypothetical protein
MPTKAEFLTVLFIIYIYMSVKIMNVVSKEPHKNYNVVRQQPVDVMMSVVQ